MVPWRDRGVPARDDQRVRAAGLHPEAGIRRSHHDPERPGEVRPKAVPLIEPDSERRLALAERFGLDAVERFREEDEPAVVPEGKAYLLQQVAAVVGHRLQQEELDAPS